MLYKWIHRRYVYGMMYDDSCSCLCSTFFVACDFFCPAFGLFACIPIPEDFFNFKVPSERCLHRHETQTYATHSMLMGSVNRCRSAPCSHCRLVNTLAIIQRRNLILFGWVCDLRREHVYHQIVSTRSTIWAPETWGCVFVGTKRVISYVDILRESSGL